MQIINSVVCDTSKGSLYKQIKPPLVGEHAFPLRGFVYWSAHITFGVSSPWDTGIILRKKDGCKQFCIDYHKLNDETINEANPLPMIDESLDQLAGSC